MKKTTSFLIVMVLVLFLTMLQALIRVQPVPVQYGAFALVRQELV